VKRLRSFSSNWILPLLLAAVVARALLPVGFMPSGGGLTFTVEMCSLDDQRREQLEIPGTHEPSACEYCLAPLLAAGFALPRVDARFEYLRNAPVAADSQIPALPLAIAQGPRAPPHA
jgi:hypothetical protein